MNPQAMEPFGASLLDYFRGDSSAELIVRRDDGQEGRIPARLFFRPPSEFTPLEETAIKQCTGRVLDVGAGTGLHSLVLQKKDMPVTAIDINSKAVEIMAQRGISNLHCADLFDYKGGPFDTILMMGHGIGMVETLAGLDRFLSHVRELVSENGQVLLDSMDVRVTDDPKNLSYHEANRQAGRYVGEIRIQFQYRGDTGPFCGWLHVDAETLKRHAAQAGWRCEVLITLKSGDYLARLTKQ